MEQIYNGGFTSGMYCKIIKPVRASGIKYHIDSTEMLISSGIENFTSKCYKIIKPVKMDGDFRELISTETIISPIGNYDSASRLYGSAFSPLEEGIRCDPDSWALDEEARAPSVWDRIVSYINDYKRPASKSDEKQAPAQKIVKPIQVSPDVTLGGISSKSIDSKLYD